MISQTLQVAAVALAVTAPQPAAAASVIPVEHFRHLTLTDGGHVVFRHGTEQRVTLIKGSLQYTRFEMRNGSHLRIEGCHRHCPSGYEVEIEIVSPDVESLGVADGGEIVARGTFPEQARLNLSVADGGVLDMRALPASQVNAAIADGGLIKTVPRVQLNATVVDGGKIAYWGNPQQVNRSIVDGGVVDRVD